MRVQWGNGCFDLYFFATSFRRSSLAVYRLKLKLYPCIGWLYDALICEHEPSHSQFVHWSRLQFCNWDYFQVREENIFKPIPSKHLLKWQKRPTSWHKRTRIHKREGPMQRPTGPVMLRPKTSPTSLGCLDEPEGLQQWAGKSGKVICICRSNNINVYNMNALVVHRLKAI